MKRRYDTINKTIGLTSEDFSGKNLRSISFRNANLPNALFVESDLRGADFQGANLRGANFTGAKTGIVPFHARLIFIAALSVSMLSGYIAMLTGQLIQSMINSSTQSTSIAGYLAAVIFILFAGFSIWRGVGYAAKYLIAPVAVLAAALGSISYFSGVDDGYGMSDLILSLVLIVVTFIVGTITRAVAGSVSTLMFWTVALLGSVYGRSVGGGIGTVIMAIACVQISKRALSGAKGFELLKKIANFITTKFGTSFRGANLDEANFTQTILHNADFTNANTRLARWDNCQKKNCKDQ